MWGIFITNFLTCYKSLLNTRQKHRLIHQWAQVLDIASMVNRFQKKVPSKQWENFQEHGVRQMVAICKIVKANPYISHKCLFKVDYSYKDTIKKNSRRNHILISLKGIKNHLWIQGKREKERHGDRLTGNCNMVI
jgi:hypothetical protein